MTVTFSKNTYSYAELAQADLKELALEPHENHVAAIIQQWQQDIPSFTLLTSGSTGMPKRLTLPKRILKYSAESSLAFLDPSGKFKRSLLCLDASKIGGMMVVIRCLLAGMHLKVLKPDSKLTLLSNTETFDLVSLVPLQVRALLENNPNKLDQFHTILIGGAPLASQETQALSSLAASIFHTYGMTETASHVALKNINKQDQVYRRLGDVRFRVDERSCLALCGTVTGDQWIQTNDVVELVNEGSFLWKGRADFVINTGGIKVHPESLEETLSHQVKSPFFVAGLPDDRLGERVVLLIEGAEPALDLSSIERYSRPKEVLTLDRFVYTDSGKINRIETLKQIKS